MSTGKRDDGELEERVETGSSSEETDGTVEATEEEFYDPKESAAETLERFLGDKIPGESEEIQGNKDKAQELEPEGLLDEKPAPKKEELGEDIDPELLPPDRFDARAKQAFMNAPKGVRRALNRAVRDLEGMATRTNQEAHQVLREWAPLREAIAPFASKWAEMGVGVVPGVLQLAAVQQKLTDPNEQVREAEYLKLAQRSRIDIVKLAKLEQQRRGIPLAEDGGINTHPAFQQQDVNSPLLQEVQSLKSQLEQLSLEREVAPIVAEMEAVRNEKDPTSGNWKYPALQNETFLNSVKPRVSELVGTSPGLSYGQALRQAHDEMIQSLLGDSYRASPSRLPASTNTHTNRALGAGFSVRGRPAPSLRSSEAEIPDAIGKDAKASLEWFMNNSRGG